MSMTMRRIRLKSKATTKTQPTLCLTTRQIRPSLCRKSSMRHSRTTKNTTIGSYTRTGLSKSMTGVLKSALLRTWWEELSIRQRPNRTQSTRTHAWLFQRRTAALTASASLTRHIASTTAWRSKSWTNTWMTKTSIQKLSQKWPTEISRKTFRRIIWPIVKSIKISNCDLIH